MKGFAPALTASSLEKMLALYMKPEDRADNEADEHAASDNGNRQPEHRDNKAEAAHLGN
jgi:hypothetical protein